MSKLTLKNNEGQCKSINQQPARVFIFHMHIPSSKTFPRIPIIWNTLTYVLKKLTLLITFER